MIKSAAYGNTVDGDLCMKMAKILDEDKAPAFMKKNKLPLESYYECREKIAKFGICLWEEQESFMKQQNFKNLHKEK